MSAELFAVIVSKRLDPGLKGCERLDDRVAYQASCFVCDLGNDRIPALALHHRDDGLPVVGANYGVAFPMTDLLATLSVRRALAQGPAVGDLPSAVAPTGVALSLLLLAAQVFPQVATLGLICVHVLVKRLVAHWQTASDLLGAPLQSQQGTGLFFHPRRHRVRITTLLGALNRQFADLLGAVAARACITAQFAADRGLVASDQVGDLRDAVLGFHKAVNLISFNLAEVFVIHRATSTCR